MGFWWVCGDENSWEVVFVCLFYILIFVIGFEFGSVCWCRKDEIWVGDEWMVFRCVLVFVWGVVVVDSKKILIVFIKFVGWNLEGRVDKVCFKL